MKLNSLKPAKGSTKKVKRIGRGEGSGRGGTSTRGNKGAQARSGYNRKIGFQGGQMPLQRTSPKFGFKNHTRVEYRGVNVASLQALSEKLNTNVIGIDTMVEAGLARQNDLVKILGNGDLTAKLEVTANAFSKSAIAKIEACEGKATII
ncbi:MAG: 50S ribosomal protein L15 [Bacteroidales bacterium]|nr:50S ribosomal protein L15 [Bacteroidales bacterium]